MTQPITKKVCRDCRMDRDIERYYRCRKSADGHQDACRACMLLRQHAYMQSSAVLRGRAPRLRPVPASFAAGLAFVIHQIGQW